MAELDIDAILRWYRFDPGTRLVRRPDAALPFVDDHAGTGPALLLDSCVYIDQFRGRAPASVARLIAVRQVNHSTVAAQELLHLIGVLDPRDRRTASAVAEIRALIRAIRPHRLLVPDPETLGRAAVLAGLLCRLQGYGTDRRMRALMDATLFLQAQKLGLTALTRNIADFDLLLQLFPRARALFYRTDDPGPAASQGRRAGSAA